VFIRNLLENVFEIITPNGLSAILACSKSTRANGPVRLVGERARYGERG
jgi:hypothetical protein